MKTEVVLERVAEALETFDRSLVKVEHELANQTQLQESTVENLKVLSDGVKELREMFVRQSEGIDGLKAMLGNYVEATQGLRRESAKLQSEVREKLKAV